MGSRRTDPVVRRLDTMRRDHFQPFDAEADEAADITQQFWGTTRGWTPRTSGPRRPGDVLEAELERESWRDEPTSQLRAIRANLAGIRQRPVPAQRSRMGGIDRTRSHGIVRPSATPEPGHLDHREATLGELAAGHTGTHKAIDADWDPFFDDGIDWSKPTQRHARQAAPAVPPRQTRQPRAARPLVQERQQRPPVEHVQEYEEELGHDVPLSPAAQLGERLGLGAADPLLVRLGAIVLVGVMLVPFARALRPDDAAAIGGAPAAAAMVAETAPVTIAAGVPVVVEPTPAPPAAAAPAPAAQSGDTASGTVSAQSSSDTASPVAAATGSTDNGVAESTGSSPAALAAVPQDEPAEQPIEAATVSTPAERIEPDCSLSYEAGAGDSWYRIADAAGVTPQALLDQNLATVDTTIFPGDRICLPAGATVPSQPTTTTAAPSTTTAPSTTKAPTTTAAPATSPAPKPASTSEVQAMIREIWPDELEEKALKVAWRESNYKATAYNGHCCWGVFQIHWTAHKSWLDDYGITSTNDLLDARKNITAAYALYQRAGGWGPWGG